MPTLNELHNELAEKHKDTWQEACELMNRLMSIGDESDQPITDFMVLRLYQIELLAKTLEKKHAD